MRSAVRAGVLVFIAYLVQATILPYLRLNNVIFDLVTIVLFTIGYTMGLYAGVASSLFCALMMEVSGGGLPGMTTAICLLAGGAGALVYARMRKVDLPGKRTLELTIKEYGPILLLGLFEFGKEFLYIAYFYIIGTDVQWMQVGRAALSAAMVTVGSVILLPAIFRYLRRRPEDTFFAKQRRKRAEKREQKKAKQKTTTGVVDSPVPEIKPTAAVPPEGGMDT